MLIWYYGLIPAIPVRFSARRNSLKYDNYKVSTFTRKKNNQCWITAGRFKSARYMPLVNISALSLAKYDVRYTCTSDHRQRQFAAALFQKHLVNHNSIIGRMSRIRRRNPISNMGSPIRHLDRMIPLRSVLGPMILTMVCHNRRRCVRPCIWRRWFVSPPFLPPLSYDA